MNDKEPGQTLFEKIRARGVVSGMWQHLPPGAKTVYAAAEVAENAIRADERERCAKVAERFGSKPAPASDGYTRILQAVDGHQVAAAIRAGEKP